MARLVKRISRDTELTWHDEARGFALEIDYLHSTGAGAGCASLSYDEARALLDFLTIVFTEEGAAEGLDHG